MIAQATYYPEFDRTEVEETILPLSRYDEEIAGVLASGAPEPGGEGNQGSARKRVRKWVGEPERHPFQRIIRSIAAGVADLGPLAAHESLFADPDHALVHVLERTEARLGEVYTRPLVAALNRAREDGNLVGATPAERYADFTDRALNTSLTEVGGLGLSVLDDVTRLLLRNEAESTRETCRRLTGDRRAIAELFGIPEDDRLTGLGSADGDTHHHGRSVSVLTFASGRRLVYKPRDVSCESVYATVAERFNTRIGTSLPHALVLERDGYGYVEFVTGEDVSDRAPAFMRASGELAAVLYLLNARDMHFENVLPTRRGPLPIDLETILHPERVHTGPRPEARRGAYPVIAQSVYGIGVLPLVMVGKDKGNGHVDLGFLGGQGQGSSPFKTMRLENPFTDEMRLVLRPQSQGDRQSVVGSLTQEETQALGEEMAEGFARVYLSVLDDPEPWTDLLREAASRIRVRYIHNPTALYSQTLRMTAGANPMNDPAVYTALLKRIAIASKTSAREIIAAEMRQLAERDVPYFRVPATGTELEDGSGTPVGAGFESSPLDQALDKVAHMSRADLAFQRTLIFSAFSARFPDNHLPESDGSAAERAPERSASVRRTGIADLAARLADHLAESALPDRFDHLPRTWIGPIASAEASRPWPPGVLGYDLYTGRTGLALALAVAARVTGGKQYEQIATQVFSTTADILGSQLYETRSVRQAGWGGYTGMSGILLGLAAAGRLLERPDWVASAQGAVPLVTEQISALSPQAAPFDMISGLSGAASCLHAVGGDTARNASAEIADRLVGSLVELDRSETLDQSGFAHGVSGLLYSLSGVHPHVTGDRRDAVEQAIGRLLDRLSYFHDPAADNWFSNVATPGSFSTGWCHGAAGIALALHSVHGVTRDPGVRGLRDTAVRNTLRDGFGRNLTWCHGDLGNHAILSEIARAEGDRALLEEVSAVERKWLDPGVIERKNANPRSRYAHTSSLMVGSAGILVHLLNRLDPTLGLSLVSPHNGVPHAD
ncbi:type 2 lanthipeptide synthetase LanM family protein [Nocardiopsis terrae]